MSTLKWQIMEKESSLARDTLSPTAERDYVEEIMSETTNGYDINVINQSRFIDSMPSADEVFGPIKKLSKVA